MMSQHHRTILCFWLQNIEFYIERRIAMRFFLVGICLGAVLCGTTDLIVNRAGGRA